MKNIYFLLSGIVLISILTLSSSNQSYADENSQMLPEKFPVYSDRKTHLVINHAEEDMNEKALATINQFKGSPGCYVACYSHNQKLSSYSVSDDIFVMGQVRVPGKYSRRICLPQGFEEADISAESKFKDLCRKVLPKSCPGKSCWAGGDTGGWFGLQQ